jgi:hypothetical protein
MKWSEHIANICKKANNTLSFLKRNLNISNSNLKEKAYSGAGTAYPSRAPEFTPHLVAFLLSSNDVHCSCSMISVADEVLLCRFFTYLADLRWTISIWCLLFC